MPENISTQSAEIDLLLREKMTDFNFVTPLSLPRFLKVSRVLPQAIVTKMAHDRCTDEQEYFLQYSLDVLPPWINYMLMDLKSVPHTFRSVQFTITGCKVVCKSWKFRIDGRAMDFWRHPKPSLMHEQVYDKCASKCCVLIPLTSHCICTGSSSTYRWIDLLRHPLSPFKMKSNWPC